MEVWGSEDTMVTGMARATVSCGASRPTACKGASEVINPNRLGRDMVVLSVVSSPLFTNWKVRMDVLSPMRSDPSQGLITDRQGATTANWGRRMELPPPKSTDTDSLTLTPLASDSDT